MMYARWIRTILLLLVQALRVLVGLRGELVLAGLLCLYTNTYLYNNYVSAGYQLLSHKANSRTGPVLT